MRIMQKRTTEQTLALYSFCSRYFPSSFEFCSLPSSKTSSASEIKVSTLIVFRSVNLRCCAVKVMSGALSFLLPVVGIDGAFPGIVGIPAGFDTGAVGGSLPGPATLGYEDFLPFFSSSTFGVVSFLSVAGVLLSSFL